jgi:hypothetical protein
MREVNISGRMQIYKDQELGQTTVSLIYTGEVYNFVELREELKQLGQQFKTRSDTEVVLRGYLEWGDKVAERLNGMFAFAIWDVRTFKPRNKTDLAAITEFPAREIIKVERGAKTIKQIPQLRPDAEPVLISSPESSILVFVLKLARHFKEHSTHYDAQSWASDAAVTDGDPEALEVLIGILQEFSARLREKAATIL